MAAKSSLETLSGALQSSFPDACCFKYVDANVDNPAVPEVAAEEEVTLVNIPPPLPSLAADFTSPENFLQELPTYTQEMTSLIEEITRGQAENENWLLYRRGRVTGSNEGADGENEESNLLRRILGHSTVPYGIPALKYGREMEGEARNAYVKAQRSTHKKLVVTEGGLFVDNERIYAGVSPDGLVQCERCGQGVLEIKCPFSISHTAHSHENVAFLVMDGDGHINVKKSHQYYSQVQV